MDYSHSLCSAEERYGKATIAPPNLLERKLRRLQELSFCFVSDAVGPAVASMRAVDQALDPKDYHVHLPGSDD